MIWYLLILTEKGFSFAVVYLIYIILNYKLLALNLLKCKVCLSQSILHQKHFLWKHNTTKLFTPKDGSWKIFLPGYKDACLTKYIPKIRSKYNPDVWQNYLTKYDLSKNPGPKSVKLQFSEKKKGQNTEAKVILCQILWIL